MAPFTVVAHNSTVAAIRKAGFNIQKHCVLPAQCVYASLMFTRY